MSDDVVLGVDIGTATSKAALSDIKGRIVATAEQAHPLALPRPGWAEHDAEETWWGDFVSLTRQLAPKAGNKLRGICVSGIGPCLLPCDAQLRPLRPAILYGIDTRATVEIIELEKRFGREAIQARSGSALSAQAVGPKLAWLRKHEPEVWNATSGWYMASSFIAARLTGEYILDHHSASQCDPLYDLAEENWAPDWAAQIAPDVPLPSLVWPADQIGTVTTAASRETGLPAGTPVMAGTIDAWAEAFSVGVRKSGDQMIMYGSTFFVIRGSDETASRNPLLWLTKGVDPGSRSLAAGMSTAGSLTSWLRALVGGPDWHELTAEAAATPPGSHGLLLLPYFAGERTPIYDPWARGVVAGLTLSHGRAELLRATYEGTALGLSQILQLLEESAGPAARAIAVGGGTLSSLWLQIVSDVTGISQEIPEQTIGACYGDCLLAAIGAGLVAPETDWSRPRSYVQPNPKQRELYAELAALYAELYARTAETVHALAALAADGAPATTTTVKQRGQE